MSGLGPTEELAGQDAYLATAEANVTEVTDGGIYLDRTVFYARGGGQPGDIGILKWDGGQVEIVDTIRRERRPLHVVADDAVLPDPGDSG